MNSDLERLRAEMRDMIRRALSLLQVQGGGQIAGTSQHLQTR
jgi:hypothetical protein